MGATCVVEPECNVRTPAQSNRCQPPEANLCHASNHTVHYSTRQSAPKSNSQPMHNHMMTDHLAAHIAAHHLAVHHLPMPNHALCSHS